MDPPVPPALSFTMPDGAVLPARVWLPQGPVRGVMLGLHGYTDSRDGWEISAPVFAANGWAFYAPDQRGFGGTASRGVWPGAGRLVDDAATVAGQLRARYPARPVVILGESMGGAVAAVLAARPGAAADAYVLLAPAVWGWGQLATPIGVALRITNAVAPAWAPDPGRAPGERLASDNIPALIRFGRDPLTLRQPSVAMTTGLVDLMSAAQAAMPALHGRVLIATGRRDQIVPPSATAEAWAKLPAAVRRAVYPHGYHLLLRDEDRALVEADILAWLANPDAWLPSGADAAAAAWWGDASWDGKPSRVLPASAVDGVGGEAVWPY